MDETLNLGKLELETETNEELENELANSGSFNFVEKDDFFTKGITKVEEELQADLEFIEDIKILE